MVLGHNGHAICTDQLSCRWFVGSCQVEQVVHVVAGPTFMHQMIILSLADHLTAMGDRLHIILILMARLIQGILGEEKWLITQQNTAFTETVVFGRWYCFHSTSHTYCFCHVFYRRSYHHEVSHS